MPTKISFDRVYIKEHKHSHSFLSCRCCRQNRNCRRATMTSLYALLLSIFTLVHGQSNDCVLLNPIRDAQGEMVLMDYYTSPSPFTFSEFRFFQPQCFHCQSQGRQICASDYKGAETYGIASGSVERVSLVTNLPYIFGLGENVGKASTTVVSVATLRESNLTSEFTISDEIVHVRNRIDFVDYMQIMMNTSHFREFENLLCKQVTFIGFRFTRS